jgi:Putative vitamin uptake transporter
MPKNRYSQHNDNPPAPCRVFHELVRVSNIDERNWFYLAPLRCLSATSPTTMFLAKMKVWTNGRYISARFITSTLCGQMVNTTVFYIFGPWGMIPTRVLTKSIVVASLTKVSVEIILLPVTLKISLWLKKIENVDYFDNATNFNPLKF